MVATSAGPELKEKNTFLHVPTPNDIPVLERSQSCHVPMKALDDPREGSQCRTPTPPPLQNEKSSTPPSPALRCNPFPGTPPTPRAEPYIDPRLTLFSLTPAAIPEKSEGWQEWSLNGNNFPTPMQMVDGTQFNSTGFSQGPQIFQGYADDGGNYGFGFDNSPNQQQFIQQPGPSAGPSMPFNASAQPFSPTFTPATVVFAPAGGGSPNAGGFSPAGFSGFTGEIRPVELYPADSPQERDRSRGGAARSQRRGRREPHPAPQEFKVFVGGLSPTTNAQRLREYFSQFGPIADAAVLTDQEKRSRGFAFVDFVDGIPPRVLDQEHFIDERRCGVRKYQYAPSHTAGRSGNWAQPA